MFYFSFLLLAFSLQFFFFFVFELWKWSLLYNKLVYNDDEEDTGGMTWYTMDDIMKKFLLHSYLLFIILNFLKLKVETVNAKNFMPFWFDYIYHCFKDFLFHEIYHFAFFCFVFCLRIKNILWKFFFKIRFRKWERLIDFSLDNKN